MTKFHTASRGAISAWALVLSALAVAPAAAQVADGDTSDARIGFSNSYSGNSFRQVMNRSFEEAAQSAVEAGIIAGYGLVSANNNVTEQAGQIQNMILEGYDAITILAGSDTALNGAVRDACDAGIVVVVFAGTVTEDCAYTVNYDWESMGSAQIDFIVDQIGGEGNILEIRGIAGDSTDRDISEALHSAAEDRDGLNFVGTVYGQWTQTVAQKEVATILPTLPEVDAVVTQGGDGYGAAQAFAAAGRDMPVIVMGNRQDELAWWQAQNAENGYETISIAATPSASQVAFWTAQQILAGKEVSDTIEVPLLTITQDTLDDWLAATPEGGVSNPVYTQEITAEIIDANASGGELPEIPAPGSE